MFKGCSVIDQNHTEKVWQFFVDFDSSSSQKSFKYYDVF